MPCLLCPRAPQFHPKKRISVEAALAHPFFDSVRAQYSEQDPVLPQGPGGFDFSFEGNEALTAAHYKRLIVEEAASLRAEKALARKMRAERDAAAAAAGGGGGAGGAGAGAESDNEMAASQPAAARGASGGR